MTREQQRAAMAFGHVTAVSAEETAKQKKYATLCMSTPAMLKQCGTVQTLAFIQSRVGGGGADEWAAKTFLRDLAAQLHGRVEGVTGMEDLLARSRDMDVTRYVHLTRELSATLLWYRRFSQSILKADPTEGMKG